MSLTKVSYSMINGVPVNVRDFGAVGDGVTDDTAAFQAAIDSLPVVNDPEYDLIGGGTVYVPIGTYRVSNIKLTSRQSLVGDGYASVIKQTVASGAMITCGDDIASYVDANAERIRISNLGLEGVATSAVVGNDGIRGNQIFKSYIDNCQITGFGDNAIWFKGGSYSYVRGCDIFDNYNRGVYFQVFSLLRWLTDCYLSDTTIRINRGPGVEVNGGAVGVQIHDCTIESNGFTARQYGSVVGYETVDSYIVNLVLTNTNYVFVNNCYFEQTSAFAEEKVQLLLTDGYFNFITNCTFNNKTNVLLWRSSTLGAASYNNFESNTFSVDNPNFKNLYSTVGGSTLRGVANNLLDNLAINLYEQFGKIGQNIRWNNSSDRSVSRKQTISGGASLTPDYGLVSGAGAEQNGRPKGDTILVNLDQNITINLPTETTDGMLLTFIFVQDATGGRTVSWNAQFKQTWSNTGNTAGKISTIKFYASGPYIYQIGAQSPYY